MNLLQETLEDIADTGHTTDDIIYIGSLVTGHCCTLEEFTQLADVDYDDGFGSQEVASDLVIVFKDSSFLKRVEYDGSEKWEYVPIFKFPEKLKPISRLVADEGEVGLCTLSELNESK